jgi:hypothetical protein
MNNSPGCLVENHREIAVALAKTDLIDSEVVQVLELWGIKPLSQAPLTFRLLQTGHRSLHRSCSIPKNV